MEGKGTHQSRHLLALSFDTLEEEEREIKKKYYCAIYKSISPSRDSGEWSDPIEHLREKSEYEESDSSSDEYDEVKCIESLTSRYPESDDRDDHSGDDEKILKWRKCREIFLYHGLVFLSRKV
jgi:hypothetical protein